MGAKIARPDRPSIAYAGEGRVTHTLWHHENHSFRLERSQSTDYFSFLPSNFRVKGLGG